MNWFDVIWNEIARIEFLSFIQRRVWGRPCAKPPPSLSNDEEEEGEVEAKKITIVPVIIYYEEW